MRATKAYIASLGTTGVLIASSLLLLALVSAIVAFRGWPELEAHEDGAQGLIIEEVRAPVPVAELRVESDGRDASATDGSRGRSGSEGDSRRGNLREEGDGEPGGTPAPQGGSPDGGARDDGSLPTDTVVAPGVPGVQEQLPGTTDDVRNGLAELTEGTTQGVGNLVGGINPNLGAPFTETGQRLGETVETLPQSGAQPLPGVPVALP